MREGWTVATLGEIADYQNGYPFKPDELGSAGLPVIRIKQLLDPAEPVDRSLVDVHRRHHISDGDLIFSWSGTLAVRFWDREPALLNQHLFRVVERSGIDRRWLRLALDGAIEGLGEKTHGTTMKHISKADLLPHPVVVPPLPEQRRIVDLIGALDDVASRLSVLADASERILRAMLHEWTSPNATAVPLTSVAEVLDNRRVPVNGSERANRPGKVPYYGAVGQVGWIDKALFDEPLVLLGEDGAGLADWATRPIAYMIEGPAWVNNHAHVLRATSVPQVWLYMSLRHYDISGLINSGTRPKLNKSSLGAIRINVPDELPARADALLAAQTHTNAVVASREAVGRLRRTVLHQLTAGEIGLPTTYDRFLNGVA